MALHFYEDNTTASRAYAFPGGDRQKQEIPQISVRSGIHATCRWSRNKAYFMRQSDGGSIPHLFAYSSMILSGHKTELFHFIIKHNHRFLIIIAKILPCQAEYLHTKFQQFPVKKVIPPNEGILSPTYSIYGGQAIKIAFKIPFFPALSTFFHNPPLQRTHNFAIIIKKHNSLFSVIFGRKAPALFYLRSIYPQRFPQL